MCLAIPARIEEIEFPIARVDFGGTKKEIRIDLLPDVQVGDYVLVHVGFAIQKVERSEAEEIRRLHKQVEEAWNI
ncbi:MAG: HypC/HybG/HupF family hydrogenase formation chaperone [Archaeoglobus sp.]|nr:HypC/HybG/HupF family hydrogenase formation chaperone [Archaeoglobus sp.]